MLDFALVAHRGHAARFPENTLPALVAAADSGITHLEFDIQLSADGVPVVLHDATLTRTSRRGGDARALPWSELRQTPVGEPRRFGDAFRDVRIPAVAEVVAFAATRPELHLFPEIKAESLETHGHAHMLPAVLDALAPVLDRCSVISFDLRAIEMARAAGARIGWCLPNGRSATRATATALAPEVLFADVADFGGSSPLWPGDWRWAFYEVTDLATARAFAARGAKLIESMRAPELLAELRAGA
jgi:glycerophosphoryl diester phosphodiesterase